MRIYAFCRTTDDLGDESGPHAHARLARWRSELEDCFRGTMPVHPVLLALRETIDRCAIPAEPFLHLIAANEQDQEIAAYDDWEALRAYCQLSAAPVGRMVLRVFGMRDAAFDPLSDDVCIGLQLANFAQDVSRDAVKGRTYLIGSDVAALGPAGATQALCERARGLLASGKELERAAPTALRLQLSLYRLGGLAICDAIEGQKYETRTRRPEVTKRTKLVLVARGALETLAPAGRRRHAQPA